MDTKSDNQELPGVKESKGPQPQTAHMNNARHIKATVHEKPIIYIKPSHIAIAALIGAGLAYYKYMYGPGGKIEQLQRIQDLEDQASESAQSYLRSTSTSTSTTGGTTTNNTQ